MRSIFKRILIEELVLQYSTVNVGKLIQIQTMSDDKLQIITADPKTEGSLTANPKPKAKPKGFVVPFKDPKTAEGRAANAYATKKTAIQTLLDVALLTKSCKMLKVYTQHYQPDKAGSMIAMIVMASIAILLQIASGILFIIIGRWNWDEEQKRPKLNKLNNASMILVFIIVLLEVIMGVFDDTENLLK